MCQHQTEFCRTLFALYEQQALSRTLEKTLTAIVKDGGCPKDIKDLVWPTDKAGLSRVGLNEHVGLVHSPEDAPIARKIAWAILDEQKLVLADLCKEKRDWMESALTAFDRIDTLTIEESLLKDLESMNAAVREKRDFLSPEERQSWKAAFQSFWTSYKNLLRERTHKKSPSRMRLDGIIMISLDTAATAFWQVYEPIT